MFYVVYLITQEKHLGKIKLAYKHRKNDPIINYMDQTIQKYYFENIFAGFSPDLLEDVKSEVNEIFKNLNADIKKTYSNSNVGLIEINLVDSLKKKSIDDFESIFELNPILSYILQEDLYNKHIKYDENTIERCASIEINSNLIFVGTTNVTKIIKTIIKNNKIKRSVYFKHDFQTPIEYMIYEYNTLLNM